MPYLNEIWKYNISDHVNIHQYFEKIVLIFQSKCKPLYNFNMFNSAQMNFHMMNKTKNPNFLWLIDFIIVTSNMIRA